MNSARSFFQLLYMGGVILVAIWQLYWLIPGIDMDRVQELMVLVFLGILAQWFAVSFPHGQMSGGFALILATFMLFDSAAAAWVAGLSILLGQGIANRGNPIGATLFNACQWVVAVVAAGYAYQWCTEFLAGFGEAAVGVYVPVLGFAICSLLLNHILIYFYLLPKRRQYPGQSWQDALKWDSLTYLITVPLGLLIALIYPELGYVGLMLLFLPVLILQLLMRHYIHLHVANRELKVFFDVAVYLNDNPQPDQLLEFILLRVRDVFSYHAGVAYLMTGERNAYSPVASSGHYARHVNQSPVFYGEGVIGTAIEEKRPIIINDSKQELRGQGEDGWSRLMRSLLVVPLMAGNEVVGVIVLGELRPASFDDNHLRILTVLGRQTVMTIEKELATARLSHALSLDFLSGMLHPDAFYQAFRELCQNSGKHDRFGILLLDVDNLKRVNAEHGRTSGDKLLEELSALVERYARNGDLAARYGGDEFILVLRQVYGERLTDLAYRLRDRVREHGFLSNLGRPVRITVSIGLAEYPQDAYDEDDLLQAAQFALEKAQKEGQNRVVVVGRKKN